MRATITLINGSTVEIEADSGEAAVDLLGVSHVNQAGLVRLENRVGGPVWVNPAQVVRVDVDRG
jgi:hypothetical protein